MEPHPACISDDDLPGSRQARRSCSEAVMVQAAQTPLRAADDPVEQLSPQLGVRTTEIEGREEHRVKRKSTAEEGSQD
jgi:hypothetical protein